MRHYCTYFDSNFLSRGLALYESLCTHEKEFTLYVLCLDDKTHVFFQHHQFDSIIPIALKEFETGDTKLIDCKTNRSGVEYIFTCTPSLLIYILNYYNNIELLTYVDADLFFFSSPEPVFNEIGNSSIAIIAHRFSDRNKHMEIYGIYNVGFLSFRNDLDGRKCLKWWRDKCIEWCYDYVDSGRFADQKYLDEWPTLFNNVCIVIHKGANLAPWNIDNYNITVVDTNPHVDGDPVIFYHFHGLSSLGKLFFKTSVEAYCNNKINRIILDMYGRYIGYLKKVAKKHRTLMCVTRKHDGRADYISIIKSYASSEIIFHLYGHPPFSLSCILRKFLPVIEIVLKLKNMFLRIQLTFQL
jgi:hypothetical protein